MKFFGKTGIRSVYPLTGPRDEYHACVPQVFKLALEDAAPQTIAQYLDKVATERMELVSRVGYHLAIAEKIRKLKLELIPENDL